MKAMVDKHKCTGCGLCAEFCPDVFEVADEVAEVIVEVVPPISEESCRDASENCYIGAISLEE